MKAKLIGAAALALALGLAACGGKSSFTINGTFVDSLNNITNIKNPGLILANGDDEISIPVGASTFSFPRQIEYGDTYTVVVKQHPQHQTCTPATSTGTAGRTESISLVMSCTQNAYSVIVTVTGLTAEGLQLINGSSGGVTVTVANPTAEFQSIPVGTSYGISIYQQPTGQTCSIVNGSGIMGDAIRKDAVVTCVKNA